MESRGTRMEFRRVHDRPAVNRVSYRWATPVTASSAVECRAHGAPSLGSDFLKGCTQR